MSKKSKNDSMHLPYDCFCEIITFLELPNEFYALMFSIKGLYEYVNKFFPHCAERIHFNIFPRKAFKSETIRRQFSFPSNLLFFVTKLGIRLDNLAGTKTFKFLTSREGNRLRIFPNLKTIFFFSRDLVEISPLEIENLEVEEIVLGDHSNGICVNLKNMEKLKELHLDPCECEKYLDLTNCNNLEKVYLSCLEYLNYKNTEQRQIVTKNVFPNLKLLHIEKTGITTISNLPHLEDLLVEHCQSLNTLSDLPSLRELEIEGVFTIEKIENFNKLEKFKYFHNPQGGMLPGIGYLCALNYLPMLKSIIIKNYLVKINGYTLQAGMHITFKNLPSLERLELKRCCPYELTYFTEEKMKVFRIVESESLTTFDFRKMKNLEEFYIDEDFHPDTHDNLPITPNYLEKASDYNQFYKDHKKLKRLRFRYVYVPGDEMLSFPIPTSRLTTNLEKLYLIGDFIVEKILDFPVLKKLKLDLPFLSIDDVNNNFKLPSLEYLELTFRAANKMLKHPIVIQKSLQDNNKNLKKIYIFFYRDISRNGESKTLRIENLYNLSNLYLNMCNSYQINNIQISGLTKLSTLSLLRYKSTPFSKLELSSLNELKVLTFVLSKINSLPIGLKKMGKMCTIFRNCEVANFSNRKNFEIVNFEHSVIESFRCDSVLDLIILHNSINSDSYSRQKWDVEAHENLKSYENIKNNESPDIWKLNHELKLCYIPPMKNLVRLTCIPQPLFIGDCKNLKMIKTSISGMFPFRLINGFENLEDLLFFPPKIRDLDCETNELTYCFFDIEIKNLKSLKAINLGNLEGEAFHYSWRIRIKVEDCPGLSFLQFRGVQNMFCKNLTGMEKILISRTGNFENYENNFGDQEFWGDVNCSEINCKRKWMLKLKLCKLKNLRMGRNCVLKQTYGSIVKNIYT